MISSFIDLVVSALWRNRTVLEVPYFRDHKAHLKVLNLFQNGRGAW